MYVDWFWLIHVYSTVCTYGSVMLNYNIEEDACINNILVYKVKSANTVINPGTVF